MYFLSADPHGHFGDLCAGLRAWGPLAEGCILLGDAGFNYDGGQADRDRKAQVEALGIPVLCLHGNHERRPATLPDYRLVSWQGGQVWVEPDFPHLLFARDGSVYRLDGLSVMAVGGAYSINKEELLGQRPDDPRWWPDEQPDAATRAGVEAALARRNWQVDVMLSHTCPARYIPWDSLPAAVDQSRVDRTTERWLDTLADRLAYGAWFCGHWHLNRTVDRLRFVYHDLVPLHG